MLNNKKKHFILSAYGVKATSIAHPKLLGQRLRRRLAMNDKSLKIEKVIKKIQKLSFIHSDQMIFFGR